MELAFLCTGLIVGWLLTARYYSVRIQIWRLRWIEMEHDLARATGREPQDIEDL